MRPSDETMNPAWSEIENDVTWATAGTAGRGAIRLMVERLPDGLWTWTAWRAIRPADCQYGSLLTREAACAAAEGAAAHMATIGKVPPKRLDQNAGRAAAG